MMKMRILSTGNVEEVEDGYAQRLYSAGYAVYERGSFAVTPSPHSQNDNAEESVKEEKLPETENETEPAEEQKPAKKARKGKE